MSIIQDIAKRVAWGDSWERRILRSKSTVKQFVKKFGREVAAELRAEQEGDHVCIHYKEFALVVYATDFYGWWYIADCDYGVKDTDALCSWLVRRFGD